MCVYVCVCVCVKVWVWVWVWKTVCVCGRVCGLGLGVFIANEYKQYIFVKKKVINQINIYEQYVFQCVTYVLSKRKVCRREHQKLASKLSTCHVTVVLQWCYKRCYSGVKSGVTLVLQCRCSVGTVVLL
jgi:hypothetical protein